MHQFSSIYLNDIIQNNGTPIPNILKINKVEQTSTYTIITYDKKLLTNGLIKCFGLFRSLIINKNNKVVCLAPPKSILHVDFIQKYYENFNDIIAEEFVEGTMINVFWDEATGDWEISTKNIVGAKTTFYKGHNSKTFRNMFFEAAKNNNLLLQNLEKNKCYSFVLQHPENRIVVPFKQPQLYLVAIYSINNTTEKGITIDVYNSQSYKDFFQKINTTVKFPEVYTFETYGDLINKYASINTSYDIVGVVIYNKFTGERTKFRNPNYEKVKLLRGNQPKLQYLYLCLRKDGKVGEFLKFFPENKKDFTMFRDQVHTFTNSLCTNYISCYIKKEAPLIEFSEQFRNHMFIIHKNYLNQIIINKKFITLKDVIMYVNDLQPSLLMSSINFSMRLEKY